MTLDEETSRQGIAAPAASGLYRTTVTVDSPARRARLDALGVVVLREPDPSGFRKPEGSTAVVLADAEQLEALACLRFEPAGSDDLAALTAAAGPEQAWLAASLRPLLAQAAAANPSGFPKPAGSTQAAEALTSLRAAMHALTPEQMAGIAASISPDDDGDGLTNTEEAWWCTDPQNPNSDGDAQGFTDGQEVRALLDFTLPRNVRWGYGPPFGPPAAWPNFNNRDGTGVNVCNDGDKDTIPDYAEVYMVGTRVPEESTDHDKFDDGQELFGTTFCPGDPPNPCWGVYPAGEYWNFIQASMPNWVLPPGDNPLVAAFPVPEVYVTPGSWHVERVTTITTSQGEMTQTSNTYETSVMRGQGTSIADTVTWNNWEEVSEAVERPLTTVGSASSPEWAPLIWGAVRVFGPKVLLSVAKQGIKRCATNAACREFVVGTAANVAGGLISGALKESVAGSSYGGRGDALGASFCEAESV
jgi:hypothetical protein